MIMMMINAVDQDINFFVANRNGTNDVTHLKKDDVTHIPVATFVWIYIQIYLIKGITD